MRNRDSLHSDNDIICSVQSQARYNLRTAVDQRGKQSRNMDAKTVDVLKDSLLIMMQSLSVP